MVMLARHGPHLKGRSKLVTILTVPLIVGFVELASLYLSFHLTRLIGLPGNAPFYVLAAIPILGSAAAGLIAGVQMYDWHSRYEVKDLKRTLLGQIPWI